MRFMLSCILTMGRNEEVTQLRPTWWSPGGRPYWWRWRSPGRRVGTVSGKAGRLPVRPRCWGLRSGRAPVLRLHREQGKSSYRRVFFILLTTLCLPPQWWMSLSAARRGALSVDFSFAFQSIHVECYSWSNITQLHLIVGRDEGQLSFNSSNQKQARVMTPILHMPSRKTYKTSRGTR